VAKTIEHRPETAPQAHRRGPARWPRVLFLAISSLLSIVLAAGSIYAIGLYKYADRNIHVIPAPTDTTEVRSISGVCAKTCTYLILGDDSRKGLSKADQIRFGNTQTVPGERSDTIILVRLDPREQKAIVLSFPRDLWVNIPHQGYGKITSAFEGGPYRTAEVVSKLTGLTIDHFLVVNLAGFQNVVKAIGGVPICVDMPMVDPLAGLNIPAGCQTLDAEQALAFVRARHVACDKIPDFSRITRQQQFLRAVLAKILQPSMIVHATTVVPAILGNLLVDQGLKNAGIAEMIYLVHKLQGISTGAVDFRSVPGDPYATVQTPAGTVDVVKLLPEAEEMFNRLREGKPLGNLGLTPLGTPPSPAVIKVRVFDDRSAGAAGKVQDFLTQSGFDIQPLATSNTLGVSGPVILYKPDTLAQAQVVQGFLKGVELKQAPNGALAQADVAVIIPASYAGPGVTSPNPTATPSNPGAACG
jgi:LCP family protein required for cell wall assembly